MNSQWYCMVCGGPDPCEPHTVHGVWPDDKLEQQMKPQTTSDRDALCHKHFPAEWYAIRDKSGASNKRNRLRKAAEEAEKREHLRKQGACCRNCSSFGTVHLRKPETYCKAQSDFWGCILTKPKHLCSLWRRKDDGA